MCDNIHKEIASFEKWAYIYKFDVSKSYDKLPCIQEFYSKEQVDILISSIKEMK